MADLEVTSAKRCHALSASTRVNLAEIPCDILSATWTVIGPVLLWAGLESDQLLPQPFLSLSLSPRAAGSLDAFQLSLRSYSGLRGYRWVEVFGKRSLKAGEWTE